jgi:biotin operon repressor
MSSKKDHESMENLERCYKIVQQSSSKGGISAIDVGSKLGMHRATVHRHLNSLELMGKVERKQGLWVATTGEQTIKPLEKEIVIELPMPKNKWFEVGRLQIHANYMKSIGFSEVAKMDETMIEKFNETRTIKIRGKNVDDIDLEKLGNLIQKASEKSSGFSLNRFIKGLKFPQEYKKSSEESKKD